MGRRSGDRNRKTSVAEAETQLNQMLDETGKKEELRDKILEDLSETAWRDQVFTKICQFLKNCLEISLLKVKLAVLEAVHEKGPENATVEDLVQDIAPKASAMVPDHIRKSMAKEIKQFLKEQQDY